MKLLAALHRELGDLLHENERLRYENAELRDYREKYLDSLHAGIDHSHAMLSGMLAIAMKPGVMDAIAEANAKELK